MDTDEKTVKALGEFNHFLELFKKDKLAAYELLKKIKLSFVKKHYKGNFPRISKEMMIIRYAENISYCLKMFPKGEDHSPNLRKILMPLKDISEEGIEEIQNEKVEDNIDNIFEKMEKLNKVLLDQMDKLQNNATTPEKTNTVANAYGKITSIAKMKMEYFKSIGKLGRAT